MFNLAKDLYTVYMKQDPIYYILYVTAACNARCKMCFYLDEIENADTSKELSFDEMRKLSNSTGRLIQLSVAGGEPTLRKDLPEICELFSKNNGVRFITLPTNGINTGQIVNCIRNIVEKCPDSHLRVSLSLDGHEELHDEIRQVPNNYKKLMETRMELKPLAEKHKNLTVDFATVLQSYNKDTIQDLFQKVHDEFQPDNHMLMIARGNVQDESVKEVPPEIYRETIALKEKLYDNKESRKLSSIQRAITLQSLDLILKEYIENQHQLYCKAGKRLLVIGERGDVRPCEILNDTLGNLRDFDMDMKQLMETAKVKETQKWIKDTKCHCTFECATNVSVLYDWKRFPNLAMRAAGQFLKSASN